MSESIEGYENYLGAVVVNDCPECEQSHFLKEEDFVEQTDDSGTYLCGDEKINVTVIP